MNKFILGITIGAIFVVGCEKKDRLTVSTSTLVVSPTAKTVLKGGALTLTSNSPTSEPTWSVSPSTAGLFSTELGNMVTFTTDPQFLGDAVVTATANGFSATSQLAVVAYIPDSTDATLFDIYSDAGIPTDATLSSNFGVNLSEISTGYTTEGINYQRGLDVGSGPDKFWGISLPATADKSTFSAGDLKFSIRLSRAMGGDSLGIKMEDFAFANSTVNSSLWADFDEFSTDWQEISIPISSFAIDIGNLKTPFLIEGTTVTSPLTFDIDAVRWEN